jgi:hypothetical protein
MNPNFKYFGAEDLTARQLDGMVMKVEDADDLRNVKSEWSANATLL